MHAPSARVVVGTIMALALVAPALVAPAFCITGGDPDGETHPNSGLAIYRVEQFRPDLGTYTVNYRSCSGTLIAPHLFLSAAHCFFGEERFLPYLWVSFDTIYSVFEIPAWPDAPDPVPNHPRAKVTQILIHPEYRPFSIGLDPGSADLAVLVLDPGTASGPLPAPATLPPAGMLDRLNEKHGLGRRQFTAVGYGQDVRFGGGPPEFIDIFERRAADSEFLALGPAYIILSMNPSRGDGGTCYGDSGGPNFLRLEDGTDILAALTVTGDAVCRATNVVYRLDTDVARSFLATVPGLPLP